MSKKKNKQQKNNTPAKSVAPVIKGVSNAEKLEINELNQSTETVAEQMGAEEQPLSSMEEAKVLEAEKAGELRLYLKYLQDINKRLNGMIQSIEAKKTELDKKISDAQTNLEDIKKQKESLDQKLEEVNQKEKSVLERELQLDNGEYTGTIRGLLEALSNSGKEISEETKKVIDSIKEEHKSVLAKEKEIGDAEIALEVEKLQLEKERKQLAKDKRKMQIDMDIFKEETEEDFKVEYSDKYEEERQRAERLAKRNEVLEKKVDDFERLKMNMVVTFGNREPEDILNEVGRIRGESNQLREQLNSRPTLEEMDALRKEKDDLTVENKRLKGLVSETELTKLRTLIDKSDSYVIEIQGYKEHLESSKNREDSLRRINEDLKSTVEQLKGEHHKDGEAFQFAHKYDVKNEEYNEDKKGKDINPQSLYDFACYMQAKIASSKFYYDMDTIRIFIAGLNMSPISILQGISGTGKTSLPREFAKAIRSDSVYSGQGDDKTPNAPYRICAVQSGWRDSMDLMGYFNSFEHKYKETEFFKALYLANLPKYSDTLFFIILDEMNLSRPEHYFADFLSLLEQNEDERFVTVNAPEEVWPKLIKGGKMKVPKNVRFIGTANHDETTLEFAPKTYDRSNLMEMPKNQERNIKPTDDKYNVSYKWLEDQFSLAKKNNESYYKKFNDFINAKKFKKLLSDRGIGVGNRFENQAERFISAFIETGDPNKKDESLAKAADHLITTRLFRSLRNRYDLNKNNLQTFQKEFDEDFAECFGHEPKKADEMLKSEIEKKNNANI